MMVKILKYNIRFVYIYNIIYKRTKKEGMIFKFNKNIREYYMYYVNISNMAYAHTKYNKYFSIFIVYEYC